MEAVRRDRAVTSLHRDGVATDAELVQTKVYKQHCLAKAAAVGPYHQPTNEQLASSVQALTAQLGTQMSAVTAQLATLSAQMIILNGKVTALTGQVTALTGGVNELKAEMQVVNRRLSAAEARHQNRSAMNPADALCPVPHGTDPVPAVFPATRQDLTDMTVASMNLLIAYYELPGVGNASEKRSRLSLHLGLLLRPSQVV
jgi:hypothetical protein